MLDAQNLVELKRAKLMTSVKHAIGEGKRRLAPDLVADQVWEMTKDKANRAAHDMVVTARNKPWLVGGIAAAVGLFLARGKVGEWAADAYDAMTGDDTEEEDQEDGAPTSRHEPPATIEEPTRKGARASKSTEEAR
ncbi:hypothetical protein [Sphingomicrobium nitratireducens]|uniref:hypothetical protein n=1 Tax=Sphingomicrobium nitratireducens TaxID=2964666 RepID=UPI002240A111|nr:hypothetical protein [Sphingomicrobium nitratireducens]